MEFQIKKNTKRVIQMDEHKEALMPLVLMHDNFPDCTRTHLNQFNV